MFQFTRFRVRSARGRLHCLGLVAMRSEAGRVKTPLADVTVLLTCALRWNCRKAAECAVLSSWDMAAKLSAPSKTAGMVRWLRSFRDHAAQALGPRSACWPPCTGIPRDSGTFLGFHSMANFNTWLIDSQPLLSQRRRIHWFHCCGSNTYCRRAGSMCCWRCLRRSIFTLYCQIVGLLFECDRIIGIDYARCAEHFVDQTGSHILLDATFVSHVVDGIVLQMFGTQQMHCVTENFSSSRALGWSQ